MRMANTRLCVISKTPTSHIMFVARIILGWRLGGAAHQPFVNTWKVDCEICIIPRCSASSVPSIPGAYYHLLSLFFGCLTTFHYFARPRFVLC